MMKFLPKVSLGREARLGALVAVLLAVGAICVDFGWLAPGIVLLVLAALAVAAYIVFVVRPARLPRDAVLVLRIADGIREDAPRSPFEQLRSRGMVTLLNLRKALEAAAADHSLKAVVITIAAPGVGLAVAQELHDLLRNLRNAGKRVIAVMEGDGITVRDYLIGCGASEIVVNPDSAFMMLGVAAGGIFLKNALERIKVQAQTLQWKEYKGAAEMFTRAAMSPELRESLDAIVTDCKAVLAESVAAARGLELERARELLGGGFLSARAACEVGLCNRTGYLEDLRAELAPDGKEKVFVGLNRYLRHVDYEREPKRRARLALIHGLGPVISGEPPIAGEFLSGEAVAGEIRRAASDNDVRAIIFRVNSPGGSAFASDLVWRSVREAQKRGKPVVVSMGDVAGSGGYYVAMAADAIVAEPVTITGSIGVLYTKFSLRSLLSELGIGLDAVKSDEVSDALSMSREMNERELAQLNQVVGELYHTFTAKVAEGRKLGPEETEAAARGRVWSGIAAKAHGLIDELGGLGRAVEIAREKAGLKPDEQHELVPYPSPGLLSALNQTIGRGQMLRLEIPWPARIAARALGIRPQWAPPIIELLLRGGISMLCPFFDALSDGP
ncbi:MAG: signal peptide peptidase SppA [Candidatus Binataceae bacterium]